VTGPDPLVVDPADFDAVGVLSDVVVALRVHSIEADVDAAATVSAPDGWHRVVITARSSGHVVVGVRYTELSTSRWHNVAEALARRDWQLDEDQEGATVRFPPGTEPTEAAFEVLAALTLGGAPTEARTVTAVDGNGAPVALG
jgi:hypothetical protein